MNYEQAKVYLQETAKYGSVLGLDTINQLLEKADHPEDDLKIIHIAGTNGKGSTLSFLSSIFAEAGYKAGCFTSPAVFHPREIIRINGEIISEEEYGNACGEVKKCADQMTAEGFAHPTAFEIEFAMAIHHFKDSKCDYVFLETGLGGKEDATNIIKNPLLCILTPVSLDHTGILGETIGEIAVQKAGIIKENSPVVSAPQLPEAEEIIKKTCVTKHSSFCFLNKDDITGITYGIEKQCLSVPGMNDIEISMAGNYQIQNAALAYLAVRQLEKTGIILKEKAIRDGFRKASWRGRFTLIRKKPLFFIDGAHNEHAVTWLKNSVQELFPDKKTVCIMAVFGDKDYENMLQIISPVTDTLITVTTPVKERALPAEELASAAANYIKNVKTAGSTEAAVRESMAISGEDGIILAFGSLSYLNQIPSALEKVKGEVQDGPRKD